MQDCMNMEGMGWMMWGAGLLWLLVFAVLILAGAALIKYLRTETAGGKPSGSSFNQQPTSSPSGY